MVNLVAGRLIVPELIQHEMTAENLAGAVNDLLESEERMSQMRADLASVRAALVRPPAPESATTEPLDYAAAEIIKAFGRQ
jgi:lipid A disaccharide synthetase